MNLPNKLTLARIALIPIFVAVYFINAIPFNYFISAGIFLIACLTDFLDGYIARRDNLVTDFGKFLDPIADKILVSTAIIIMLIPVNNVSIMPWYASICVAVILARELLISGFRLIAAGKGQVIAADKSGKIKTFLTDVAVLILLVSADLTGTAFEVVNLIGLITFYLSTALTVYSGAECIIKNKHVIETK